MVVNNLKLIFSYFKLNFMKAYQYKVSFFMQIIMMILNDAFFIIQWLIIFSFVDSVGGYGFSEVMILWGLSAGTFGISRLFFNNAFHISDIVHEGKLDVYMTQPKNLLMNVICSSSDISCMGDIAYTYIAFAIAGAPWWFYIASVPFIIMGGLIMVAVSVVAHSLCFYIKNASAVSDVVNRLMMAFINYPPVIFSFALRVFMYAILPIAYITFVPLEAMLISFSPLWLLAMLGVTILWVVLAFIVFYSGVKRYSSSNLMTARM